MINDKKFTWEEFKEFKEVLRNRRECLFSEVQQLSSVLQGLTNSYRILIGAAEEFNRISFSSKQDVDHAVDRADDLGDLIDDVIDALEIKLKIYLKDIKKMNMYDKKILKYELEEKDLLSIDDFNTLEYYISRK